MSFSRLIAIQPASSIEERLLFEMRELYGTLKCQADYFDFYLEDEEDSTTVKALIESFGFVVELLSFDEQLIYRNGMTDCRIPPVKLLRIYNENENNWEPANQKS